jgi:DNA-binding response OmpR family regulator
MARILIVDDQLGFVEILKLNLRHAGYEVATACDGAEAFQQILAAKPDLILLDVVMPIVDGFSVLETIKSDPELCHIPVVMLTARNQAEDMARGHHYGADLYITKPFEREELLLAIRRLLDAPERECDSRG